MTGTGHGFAGRYQADDFQITASSRLNRLLIFLAGAQGYQGHHGRVTDNSREVIMWLVRTFLFASPIPISGEQQTPSVTRMNVHCKTGIKEASVYRSTAT